MKREMTFDTGDKMYHLGISYAYPNVISGGSADRIENIANYLDNVEEVVESDRKHITVHGSYKGIPITAFNTGMGSASVSITLPEIIEACDEPDMLVLRIGTSGGLKEYMNIGDFVITTEADRAESTSDKIMGRNYIANSDLCFQEALFRSVSDNKEDFQNVYIGKTRVTDDIYFDAALTKYVLTGKPQRGIPELSEEKLVGLRERFEDVWAVSMEFSVYCALRDRYNKDFGKNIKAGNLLVVSDNVVREAEQVDMTEFLERKDKIEKAHIISGLNALVRMSKK
jgi:uridine phosphorylase